MTFTPPAPPVRRPRAVWDLWLTIALLLVAVLVDVVVSFFAVFLVFASDACVSSCDSGLMSIGFLIAIALPTVALVLGIIAAILLLVFRRRAFWIPLVVIALEIGLYLLGAAVTYASTLG
jgi:hypothetical protein